MIEELQIRWKAKLLFGWKHALLFAAYLFITILLTWLLYLAAEECHNCVTQNPLILNGSAYEDSHLETMTARLLFRIEAQPFNLVSFIIFLCAVIHTFLAPKFNIASIRLRQKNIDANRAIIDTFAVEFLRFMGEVEVIFGIWVIPLLVLMTISYNWSTSLHYLSHLDYIEPIFVVVIMALASSRPIVVLAEYCLKFIARLGGESVQAWWWCILTIGPLAGSLITEPGAMTISALLLGKQFYHLKPGKKLAYATLGLLFVNVSVGGVLTSFAAPPVLMVSKAWGWTTGFMFKTFGMKAFMGIFLSNLLYFLSFHKELRALEHRRRMLAEEVQEKPSEELATPFWIILTHIVFLVWIVLHSHYPVMFVGSFLIFIGFHQATLPYQNTLSLKTPILVGFFLAGLVVHGNLQAWWITPVLGNLGPETLMVMSTILTAFNDNAEITFLASLIPSFSETMKYVVVAGAVTGGGLTVIANAPNPLGQALLGDYFPEGIRPWRLMKAAFIPTLIVGLSFWLFQ